jgi:tRNA(fMet)-specific endonuclease VapC
MLMGTICAATQDKKKNPLYKLIAAHAKALDVILVTNNERDFAAYPGIRTENWINKSS